MLSFIDAYCCSRKIPGTLLCMKFVENWRRLEEEMRSKFSHQVCLKKL